MTRGGTGDLGGAGTDSMERQITSVFDFLEEPDSGSGCEYWGVNQRHTLSVTDPEEEGGPGGAGGPGGDRKDSSDDEVFSLYSSL